MGIRELDFVTYCIGLLSRATGVSQPEIYQLLLKTDVLYGYIVPEYEVLHTFSGEYLKEELIEVLKERGVEF